MWSNSIDHLTRMLASQDLTISVDKIFERVSSHLNQFPRTDYITVGKEGNVIFNDTLNTFYL